MKHTGWAIAAGIRRGTVQIDRGNMVFTQEYRERLDSIFSDAACQLAFPIADHLDGMSMEERAEVRRAIAERYSRPL